jgi:glucokinase
MILAGDVGGTKTRLALADDGGAIRRTETYASASFPDLESMVSGFLGDDARDVTRTAFGVAGPVIGQRATLVNLHWDVDGPRLARHLKLPRVCLLNDLEATAYGIASLSHESILALNPEALPVAGNKAVIAAGTGLGEAFIVGGAQNGERARAIATEGGHADFAPRTDTEIALLTHLRERHGHVSYERVLSGPGLVNVYEFLRDTGRGSESDATRKAAANGDAARAISEAALAHDDALAREALRMFAAVYGAEAGNLALRAVAVGGVYVGGGIAPKIEPALTDGVFLEAFVSKGRLASLVRTIPVYLIRDPDTALRGAVLEAMHEDSQ